jgi:hypothetical protein
MAEQELEQEIETASGGLDLHLPLWGKLLVFGARFLPIPGWLKALLPIAIGLIEALPKQQRTEAKKEIKRAAQESVRSGNAENLVRTYRQRCSGIGCPPDLVGDRAREERG